MMFFNTHIFVNRGGIMDDFLIKEFIERMTKEDVKHFANKNGIILEKEELDLIYTHLKKNWRTFYYGNPKKLLEQLKKELKDETFNKIEALYIQLKNKLDN